jgi:hypothetical protein
VPLVVGFPLPGHGTTSGIEQGRNHEMAYGLDDSARLQRGDRTSTTKHASADLRWKSAGEECRLQLVQHALAAQRPTIGGFPIAL